MIGKGVVYVKNYDKNPFYTHRSQRNTELNDFCEFFHDMNEHAE